MVGWPPIKSRREKHSTFVKVKMEGVVIARKVDLSLHNSYQQLKDTLDDMFERSGALIYLYTPSVHLFHFVCSSFHFGLS